MFTQNLYIYFHLVMFYWSQQLPSCLGRKFWLTWSTSSTTSRLGMKVRRLDEEDLTLTPFFFLQPQLSIFRLFFFFMSAKTFVFSFFSLLLSPTKPLWILIRQKKQFFASRRLVCFSFSVCLSLCRFTIHFSLFFFLFFL